MIQHMLADIRNKKMERNRKEKAFRSRQTEPFSLCVPKPCGEKGRAGPCARKQGQKRTSGQIEHLKAFFKASFRKGMRSHFR